MLSEVCQDVNSDGLKAMCRQALKLWKMPDLDSIELPQDASNDYLYDVRLNLFSVSLIILNLFQLDVPMFKPRQSKCQHEQ